MWRSTEFNSTWSAAFFHLEVKNCSTWSNIVRSDLAKSLRTPLPEDSPTGRRLEQGGRFEPSEGEVAPKGRSPLLP